jgi:hypothetical protein
MGKFNSLQMWKAETLKFILILSLLSMLYKLIWNAYSNLR